MGRYAASDDATIDDATADDDATNDDATAADDGWWDGIWRYPEC